ncbi:MAG: sulfotransferase [Microthrixaceae bacterium]
MSTALWIVGTTRSGTSWMFDLVASHPDVSMGYESKIPIEGIGIYERWRDRLGDPLAMAGLLEDIRLTVDDPSNAGNNEVAFTQPDLALRIHEAHEAAPGWATVCEHLFRSVEGTSHWGNKMLRIEQTPTILEHWPDSRFLVLVRDPRGVVASQSVKFGHSLDYSAMYWLTHAEWVLERLPGDDRYRVVDLVEAARDPRPHLEWLFSSAGLSTEPIDELIERFPGDPERLQKWRHELEPEVQRRMEEYCFEPMGRLGYEPELATGPRRLSTLRRLWAQAETYGARPARAPGEIGRKQVIPRLRESLRRS